MYLSDISSLRIALAEVQIESTVNSLLLFAADKNQTSSQEMKLALAQNNKPLIGGIFPELISEGKRFETGFVLIKLEVQIDVAVIDSKKDELNFIASIQNQQKKSSEEVSSVLCFVNALWPLKQGFMNDLYDYFGPFITYCGGGAGSLNFTSFPCIFANHSIYEHAAVLGLIKESLAVGVAHGWQPIAEPIKVTETAGNTILSLNWRPAFDVYREQILSHSGKTITRDNFFEIAKSYPLGLLRLDDEMIIRDPYATENGSMHIVDEVPQGEYIHIMHGDLSSLLSGAQNALNQSSINGQGSKSTTKLCIDCISRVLFMQEEYEKELKILNQGAEVNGILSIGEIANPQNSSLELFNKTVVVAQW